MSAGTDLDRVSAGRRFPLWRIAFVILAIAYGAPLGWQAFERLVQVNYKARERLVLEHRLWELEPAYKGKPENWARFASRLLTDRQLMSRVHARYGAQAHEVEIEYRRDLTLARAEVLVVAVALWAAPLLALYGAVAWTHRRRRRMPPPRVQPPSASDPRYRPPGD